MNRRNLFKLLGGVAAGVAVSGMPGGNLPPQPDPGLLGPTSHNNRPKVIWDEIILTDKDPFTVVLPPPEEGRVIHIKNCTTYEVVTVCSDGRTWLGV
jgi:hypothetical protein